MPLVGIFVAPLTIQPRDAVVRLVQLTDNHLCAEPGGTLLGMDTDHALQAVIARVLRERPAIDLVLGTGDLSDQGAASAYARLTEYLQQIPAPALWLPGNHDNRDNMLAAAPGEHTLCGEARIGNWQVLMLDSQVPGEIGGELGAAELQRLQTALESAREADLNSLVCLHHQPVPIGCTWLDEQRVADADALFALLDEFPGVRALLWGHVHQEFDQLRGELRLLASPSTCVQFAPNQVDFKADDKPPGYRWLDLHPDGRIDTGVSRVDDVAFTVDLETGGYL